MLLLPEGVSELRHCCPPESNRTSSACAALYRSNRHLHHRLETRIREPASAEPATLIGRCCHDWRDSNPSAAPEVSALFTTETDFKRDAPGNRRNRFSVMPTQALPCGRT